MKKLLLIVSILPGVFFVISICLINCKSATAQEEKEYFIDNADNGSYLVHGTRSLIKLPENRCYERIDNPSLTKGDKFMIMRLRDEMDNDRGVIIFDKNGNQINYDKVQEERKKHYKSYNCCVYVEELNGKLYFWDMLDLDGQDYDCYLDSQTDASMYIIPRYYIFNHKANNVETKVLTTKCTKLILDGKINCE